MDALRADGFGGQLEFSGEALTIRAKGLGAAKKPPRDIELSTVLRADFKPATRLTNGHIRVAVPGVETKVESLDANCVFFTRKQMPQFEVLYKALVQALLARGELSVERIEELEQEQSIKSAATAQAKELKNQEEIAALMRKMAGAVYDGHIVDYKGYRYGLGLKRPIAGATAEFESGADRTRPTLTRIGAGAILAGPVGAIAGGMFKKDKTKGYVTIVFPDGASVIIDGPAKDEKKMRSFAQQVNAIAQSEQQREGGPAPEPAADPVADQLLKLKQLHEAGVLTDEQYEEKSVPLISQL